MCERATHAPQVKYRRKREASEERMENMNQTTLKSPEASGKLNWGIRFAYGCGDTACNLVFGMMSTIRNLFST